MKKKLAPLFSELSKTDKNYVEVWLAEEDFGGYRPDKYVLNAVVGRPIKHTYDDIEFIVHLLAEKAKEEFRDIMRVKIHRASDEVHCGFDEVLVYSEEIE